MPLPSLSQLAPHRLAPTGTVTVVYGFVEVAAGSHSVAGRVYPDLPHLLADDRESTTNPKGVVVPGRGQQLYIAEDGSAAVVVLTAHSRALKRSGAARVLGSRAYWLAVHVLSGRTEVAGADATAALSMQELQELVRDTDTLGKLKFGKPLHVWFDLAPPPDDGAEETHGPYAYLGAYHQHADSDPDSLVLHDDLNGYNLYSRVGADNRCQSNALLGALPSQLGVDAQRSMFARMGRE